MFSKLSAVIGVFILVIVIYGCKTPVHKAEPDAKTGEMLTLGGTSFRVYKTKTLQSILFEKGLLGDGPTKMEPEDPNELYFRITLTITNLSNNPTTISSEKIALFGGDGQRYYAFARKTDPSIDANTSVSLFKTFVLQRKAVSGARLQVEDLFSNQTGIIDLDNI